MPMVSDAPEAMNKIMEAAYSEALKKYKGDKKKASQIAWGAAKNAGYVKGKDGKWMMKKKEMTEEIVIDAFKEGTYPQGTFAAKELSEIASSYDPKVYEAPILIGHASDYKGKTQIPAFGWIGKIKVVGDHLKLVASQFTEELKGFVKDGLYKKVSAAFFQPDDPNNPTPGKWHFHHLAFLGGAAPAVKGLEGIAFAEITEWGIEFAEVDTEIEGVDTDPIEEVGTADTIKDLTESCANFISKIEANLTSDVDYDTQKSRCSLAAFDLQSEIQSCLDMHWMFQEKLENIEEHQEAEMSEKGKGKLKRLIIELAQKFTNKQIIKESNMDKEQEAKLNQEIADLKKQNAEFAEAKMKAEQTATETADKSLRAEIKTFCESNKLNTNKHKEMRVEDMLFAAAKANQNIEFSSKDKDGKDVKENRSLLAVLQETLKGFQIAQPKEGEMTEFNQKLPDEKAKNDIDAKVTKYYNDHKDAKEFTGITQKQAEYNILRNHLAGQITL